MILARRVAIVTGAGSGIGRAGALKLAGEGAAVVTADRDAASGEATAAAIRAAGGVAEPIATDCADDAQIEALVAQAAARFGRIDILHSHAGIQVEGTLEQVAPQGMDASWRLNVRSHFTAARAVLPHMRRQGGGSVIVTSSNSGVFYDREMIAYATTKHAVVAMVRQMALDYAREGIRFNALCPGWVDTPFNAPFMRQMGGRAALEAHVRDRIPMGRWATADEIAEAILFLASDRSSFMTGHALVIDGGECIA
ncbi:glucose 1-dehydrogenase [Limibaculum sp. FT325]|uniref:SDR family NAD(P)-dependent oxidoreductase n=1 Tax=Thermohalobaculum sediminis TaxID=2939436 RepID=UPI0020BF7DF0|nr:glucose 1-dehydrogenase [Limibaculum sediminis]MCL5776112.1 glucose 1-dehydrogenase [Limibaculum sediminis]